MLGLVQNWFSPRCSPIGVDFGTDCLRLAQVQWVDGDWRLIAAASADVPAQARQDAAARWAFFAQTTRDLLSAAGFRGRTAMLGLPAASMYIQHLRVPKMDENQMKDSLPWEARGKLPIDPANAMMRHLVAGEVYVEQETWNEVILLASHRQTVEQLLAAAAKARLDVVGMNVEPMAVLDCFTQVYRRDSDAAVTNFFVDIGATGSRAMLTRGRQILFARAINIGGDHFTAAVASAMKISPDQAKALRIKLGSSQPGSPVGDRVALNTTAGGDDASSPKRKMEEAVAPLLGKLIEELNLCRRYFEATFPSKPVDRMVFIGGESRHRWQCQQIAKELGLAAQVGDPLCRMSKQCEVGIESGIDRRQPQPGWAVAIGLSMGPDTPEGSASRKSSAGKSSAGEGRASASEGRAPGAAGKVTAAAGPSRSL
jgi:type IV pilus assembly protein PilM